MNIGEKLKNAREEKGITLEEIQKNTKIRTKYLEAIEDNNFKVIPGNVYVKAFIKEYARQLNLDAEELIHEYQNIINVKKVKEIKEINENNDNNKFKTKKIYKLILIVIIAISLVILTFYIYNIYKDNNNENLISKEEVTKSTAVSNKNKIIDQQKNNDHKIILYASEKSWVKVIADGKEVFQGFILPEGQYEYSAENKLEIKIGNGNGIRIKTKNKIFGPFGSTGEVINFDIKFIKEHIK